MNLKTGPIRMSCYNILHFSLFWEGIFEICLFAKGKHLNNQKFTLSSLATGGNAVFWYFVETLIWFLLIFHFCLNISRTQSRREKDGVSSGKAIKKIWGESRFVFCASLFDIFLIFLSLACVDGLDGRLSHNFQYF